jgi:hypothetical protein
MDSRGEEEADDIDMDEDLFSPRDAQLDQESDDDESEEEEDVDSSSAED